jgi:transcriptional regulator with XRE-family HTH domain
MSRSGQSGPLRASEYLAANVRNLRRKQNMSQEQLALRAGMPRSTVTNIESGGANPSLANLALLSTALGVGLEEILSRPRSECQLLEAADVPVRSRSHGAVSVRKLLPERVRGLELDRLEIAPGASMAGTPHITGTKEYLYCLAGEVTVLVAGEAFVVDAGDVLAFPGDQAHSYRNRGRRKAEAISVVVPIPF